MPQPGFLELDERYAKLNEHAIRSHDDIEYQIRDRGR